MTDDKFKIEQDKLIHGVAFMTVEGKHIPAQYVSVPSWTDLGTGREGSVTVANFDTQWELTLNKMLDLFLDPNERKPKTFKALLIQMRDIITYEFRKAAR